MTRKELKRWLKQYSALKTQLEGLRACIKAVEEDKNEAQYHSPQLDGLPRSKCIADPTAELVVRYEQRIAAYAARCEELIARMDAIETALELVKPEAANLLRRYYLLGQDWETISKEVSRSLPGCYKLAREALDELVKVYSKL